MTARTVSDLVVSTYRKCLPKNFRRLLPQGIRVKIFQALNPSAAMFVDPEEHFDITEDERQLYAEVAPLICQSPAAAISLVRAVEYLIANDVPGAFVECGVYRGGSIVLVAKTLVKLGITDRDIYLYDTFEGMPKPEAVDIHRGTSDLDLWDKREIPGTTGSTLMRVLIDEVRETVRATGYPIELIHFVKGMVEDTISKISPQTIALLRLDTDYYKSTRHELMQLYPRLSPGGILIIDDYGAFEGARKAVDEYLSENRIAFFLGRCDASVRIGVKASA
jgi:O-methyltransferase